MKQIILMSSRPNMTANYLNKKAKYLILKYALHEGDEVHIYCTKGKDKLYEVLHKGDDCYGVPYPDEKPTFVKGYSHEQFPFIWNGLGQVVAKFIVGSVDDLSTVRIFNIEELSCLTREELQAYYDKGRKGMYALEITHLEIFDRQRELGEFHFTKEYKKAHDFPEWWDKPISHAPQSWQYALVEE